MTEYVPSRRGDWPDSSNDPFDYTRDPLEQKGLLERRGGTVNEAILGIQRPINGGIVLYRDARNSPEGQLRLDGVLNGPQSAVEEKGDRNIGPFDCRGLTGFGCCLLVKHSVVDADVDGRAIQVGARSLSLLLGISLTRCAYFAHLPHSAGWSIIPRRARTSG